MPFLQPTDSLPKIVHKILLMKIMEENLQILGKKVSFHPPPPTHLDILFILLKIANSVRMFDIFSFYRFLS